LLAPASSLSQMRQVIFNDYVNGTLCALFIFVVLAMVASGARAILAARRSEAPTARETEHAMA
jgi:carbon starvation protein